MSTGAIRLQYRALSDKISTLGVIKINWKLIYALAFVFALLMLMYYMYEVNQLTQGTFLIKNDNKQLSELVAQNTVLENTYAQANFLGTIANQAEALNFQKTTNVTYVQLIQNSLAEAK